MRCPYCDHVLEDAWVKKMGAALMGKASGEAKSRGSAVARGAAKKRWEVADLRAEIARLRAQVKKRPKPK